MITVYLYYLCWNVYTTVLQYSDSFLYRSLAYVCEGTFAMRMYVALMSSYPWDWALQMATFHKIL